MLNKDKIFNLPNILSVSRGLIMPVLFYMVFNLNSDSTKIVFVVLYIIAGITDAADGYIARKYDCCSDLGADLDSYADILYYLGSAVFIYVFAQEVLMNSIWFLLFTLIMFVLEIVISWMKFKKPLFLHTLLSKFSGFMVFLTVIVLTFNPLQWLLVTTILLYGISFIENIIVFFVHGEVSPNFKGLLFERKRG